MRRHTIVLEDLIIFHKCAVCLFVNLVLFYEYCMMTIFNPLNLKYFITVYNLQLHPSGSCALFVLIMYLFY